jgi:7,8-dihydropterin-6-yl-methyl-4-(beta-D-ribofuranosyl)aminobenzene 5'-phosphate synthase
MTLSIVYNNVVCDSTLAPGWGMGCVIEGLDKTILFDTGGQGAALLSNMRKMGIRPGDIDLVFLSHIHGDHTGGLWAFLDANSDVTVYLPASFPSGFKEQLIDRGARVVEVSGPKEVFPGVYTTGALGTFIEEQALVMRSAAGSVIVTGCAHPGVVAIAEKATQILDGGIYLVTGGFHLGGASDEEIQRIVKELKALGVQRIGPSHCTGERALRHFKSAWDQDFIEGGCGATITVPITHTSEIIKDTNIFYREASFHGTEEILSILRECGFENFEEVQTIFGDLSEIHEVQEFEEGYGKGGFVVVYSEKQQKI